MYEGREISGRILVPEELIGEAIEVIKRLLERNYLVKKTKNGFIANTRGHFASELAASFLVKTGHARWIGKMNHIEVMEDVRN